MSRDEKFWDFIARNYDAGEGDPAGREDIQITRKYLHQDATVLEYGCGTGTLSLELAGQVKAIHALDISSKMLAAARKKAAERHVENIHFVQATLSDHQYQPESFDAVLAFNILHLLKDVRQALQAFDHLLKPGGFFISNTPCLDEKKTFANSLLFPLFYIPSKLGMIPHINLFKMSGLEQLVARSGYELVETKEFFDGVPSLLIVARKSAET